MKKLASKNLAQKSLNWLSGGGSKSLKICLAAFAVMSATSSFAVAPIEIGATALNSGGYEMALVRKLSDGVGLGLVAGQAAEQKYFGAHYQMPAMQPFSTAPEVHAHVGFGVARTTAGWTSTTGGAQITAPGRVVGAPQHAPSPSITTSGTEYRWTSFVSGEISYQLNATTDVFAELKWFPSFASHDGSNERSLGGVGLRLKF